MGKDVRFSVTDAYLFGQGKNYASYETLGAHPCTHDGVDGVYFAVWAPNAKSVSVLTSGQGYDETKGEMKACENNAGVWELFVPGCKAGEIYRYAVTGADGVKRFKSDPYSFAFEKRPANGSVVASLEGYEWGDREYMEQMSGQDAVKKPMAIYEVHLGSWKKDLRLNSDGFLNYRALADQLAEYVNYMGYTHVELIGICEHPFDGSWGYQCSGFFAPTSRHGSPDDFRYLVDRLHQAEIGVILDWVPAHFPKDAFCMGEFDGTHLYEYSDPLRMDMPGWGTYAFDHGKNQVKSFLISSAMYWIREFHMDGLRVDAVAALLLNNFDRGDYRPNIFGGVENLEGMAFVRQLNDTVHSNSRAFIIAEDSSITAGVTAPTDKKGLGFDFKWNLGWMNETLRYFAKDPIYRQYEHGLLIHPYDYTFTENFVLVLSHDEVVHLKHSMLEKMPGSTPDKLANLKALYALQFTSPGKKLLFMGQEFAEDREWSEAREINWWFAGDFGHRDVMQCVRNLLSLYRTYPVLYSDSKNSVTFEWVNNHDASRNLLAYIRRNPWNYDDAILVIANLSPVAVQGYSCGVPEEGYYQRVFSTYDSLPGQGGPGEGNSIPPLVPVKDLCDGYDYRLTYDLRPFEVIAVRFPQKPKKPAPEKVTPGEEAIPQPAMLKSVVKASMEKTEKKKAANRKHSAEEKAE